MTKTRKYLAAAVASFLVCLGCFVPLQVVAQSSVPSATVAPPPPILLGTAWYPEQWPESRWPADLDLMQKAGIRFVRVGEFAWSRMEPSEGDYHFGWLDRFGLIIIIFFKRIFN